MTQDGLIAALDIGTHKVVCLIGEQARGSLKVRGAALRRSEGMRGGAVTDAAALEDAVRAAVGRAEQAAGAKVDQVAVSVSATSLLSQFRDVTVALEGKAVTRTDIEEALIIASKDFQDDDGQLIHAFPAALYVDGDLRSLTPNLVGQEMTVYGHFISAASTGLQNIAAVLAGAHLEVSHYVAKPLASGLGCLTEEEREVGSACLDLGGATTSLGLFANKTLAHGEILQGAADRLIVSIATEFVTTLAEAERLLAVHGAAVYDPADDRTLIEYKTLDSTGEQEVQAQRQRRDLTLLIQNYMIDLLEGIDGQLEAVGFTDGAARRLVATGGLAQLSRLSDLSRKVLGVPLRVGGALPTPGLPVSSRGPAFSAVRGLLDYAAAPERFAADFIYANQGAEQGSGLLRLFHWVRENF